MDNEIVVLLMREFGWTLEYTVGLVRKLPIKKLNALIEELNYQKRVEQYNISSNFAMCLANWATSRSKNKRYRVTDFIGPPPQRSKSPIEEAARKAGVKLPKE